MKLLFVLALAGLLATPIPSTLYVAQGTVVANDGSVVEFELENGNVYSVTTRSDAVENAVSCPVGTPCVTFMDSCGTPDPTDDVVLRVAYNAILEG